MILAGKTHSSVVEAITRLKQENIIILTNDLYENITRVSAYGITRYIIKGGLLRALSDVPLAARSTLIHCASAHIVPGSTGIGMIELIVDCDQFLQEIKKHGYN